METTTQIAQAIIPFELDIEMTVMCMLIAGMPEYQQLILDHTTERMFFDKALKTLYKIYAHYLKTIVLHFVVLFPCNMVGHHGEQPQLAIRRFLHALVNEPDHLFSVHRCPPPCFRCFHGNTNTPQNTA